MDMIIVIAELLLDLRAIEGESRMQFPFPKPVLPVVPPQVCILIHYYALL